MARKTKAELVAEYKEAQVAHELQLAEQYTNRLMAALEEATTMNNFELTVRGGVFYLHDRDNPDDPATTLSIHHNRDGQTILESLEWILNAAKKDRAVANRLDIAKKAAMTKLSPEEQALLGLV